jgi:hypothetical protein
VGVSPDAPAVIRTVADAVVKILSETLGGGVGTWDFAKLAYDGAAMTGDAPGALPRGKAPLRIWIGSK